MSRSCWDLIKTPSIRPAQSRRGVSNALTSRLVEGPPQGQKFWTQGRLPSSSLVRSTRTRWGCFLACCAFDECQYHLSVTISCCIEYGRDWNATYTGAATSDVIAPSVASDSTETTAPSTSIIAQQEQDGPTPSPIFVTLDDTTRGPPAASQTKSQSPPASSVESAVESQTTTSTTAELVFLPPPFSTIKLSTTSTSAAEEVGSTNLEASTLPPMLSTISLPPHLTSALPNGSSAYPADPASTSTGVPDSPDEEASSSASQTGPLKSSLSFSFPLPGDATTTATSTIRPIESSTTPNDESLSTYTPTTGVTSTAASLIPGSSLGTFSSATSPSSTAVRVTGTPNDQVPTIRTSTPAASATVSPEVAANNLASAKSFNTLFASLTEQSACAAGQIACVKGNVGICSDNGAFEIKNCGVGTACFALPMNTTDGVIVGCYDPQVASEILGTPMSAPGPGPSTTASPASDAVSDITTTITPIIIATSTVLVTAPGSPSTSPVVISPGFTTTVVVTKTVQPATSPSATAPAEGESSTTSSSRSTRTSTSASETKSEEATSETPPITRSSSPSSTAATATATETFTDTLIVNPIDRTVANSPRTFQPTTALIGTRTLIIGGNLPTSSFTTPAPIATGAPVLTVFVTVTQKERETVTVTVTA
ncbi:hypothetical protein CCHL11_02843 [Colletotrichum chlorophyti]|uniref:Carbohydrate-binding module family 19 domain-containing protein n=1 Tax=Colletotrichum chlorophyti TaxID=708187 RepID=A0A1Q8S0S8_9PEZI|nr:hypothetical protein CCHL11_02843 [Colletotrichum chlorophyti]